MLLNLNGSDKLEHVPATRHCTLQNFFTSATLRPSNRPLALSILILITLVLVQLNTNRRIRLLMFPRDYGSVPRSPLQTKEGLGRCGSPTQIDFIADLLCAISNVVEKPKHGEGGKDEMRSKTRREGKF